MYKSNRQELSYNNISYNNNDNNNNVSITIYRIFRTLAHLMPESYLKPCQICKMMRHIENPGRVRTVYSDIFSDIQGHSAIFNHVQGTGGH